MKSMSAWQFTFFRIIFGSYLAIHFFQLIPYAGELFGCSGVLDDPSLNPTHGLFPNPLNLELTDRTLEATMLGLGLLSLSYAAGLFRHPIALLLWFGWTALFHRNNLIANPSLAYVGLLLVLTTLTPRGEPWSFPKSTQAWSMPVWVYRTAWILMSAGYSFSGFTKLASPSWLDGDALHFLLHNPLARPGIVRDALMAAPDGALKLLTWGTLAAELLFLPLALWSRSRPWIWLTMVGMHLGILLVIDFADLSIGMLMIHIFTFDPDWLPPKGTTASPRTLAFDGECLMCSRTIRFLAHEDRGELLRFTPLQGAHGTEMKHRLDKHQQQVDSMILQSGDKLLIRSDAVLGLLDSLGGHWRIISLACRMIPRPHRDAVYDSIASRRHSWPALNTTCDMPDEQIRKRWIK